MSRVNEVIRNLKERGFTFNESGNIVKPDGNVMPSRVTGTDQRGYYHAVKVKDNGVSRPIPVHRFISYMKYGDTALRNKVQTRHLNGVSTDNTPSNIAIGSASDNAMDRNPDIRKTHSDIASSYIKKLSAEAVKDIRESEKPLSELARKYRVAKSTISYARNGRTYNDSV
jgi:hypothetical protein